MAVTSHLAGYMLYIIRVQDDPHVSPVAIASEALLGLIHRGTGRKTRSIFDKYNARSILLFLSITQSYSNTEPELCLPYCWIKLKTEKMGRTTPFSSYGSTASEKQQCIPAASLTEGHLQNSDLPWFYWSLHVANT